MTLLIHQSITEGIHVDYGRCKVCGGAVTKDWGGIVPQFHCVTCGVTAREPGVKSDFSSSDVARLIKLTLRSMHRSSGDLHATMRVVNHMMKGRCPKVSRSQLELHGIRFLQNKIMIMEGESEEEVL